MGLHDGHRQRMRQQFLSHGPQSMADHELLELALFYATAPAGTPTRPPTGCWSSSAPWTRVLTAPEQELEQVEGVGQNAAVLLRLIGAMGDRARQPGREEKIVASVDQAGAYFLRLLDGAADGAAVSAVRGRQGKGPILSGAVPGAGGHDGAEPAAGGGKRPAVRGQRRVPGPQPPQRRGPAPLRRMFQATVQVRDALKRLDIRLIDHIIVADGDYVSMASSGLLR